MGGDSIAGVVGAAIGWRDRQAGEIRQRAEGGEARDRRFGKPVELRQMICVHEVTWHGEKRKIC
jgi:hypothetical protein